MQNFGRRAVLAGGAAFSLAACISAPARGGSALSIDISKAPLGQNETVAANWLAARHIKGGQTFGRYRIYETPVFEAVFERQRLVLNLPDGVLQSVFVIINPSFADTVERTFADVFEQMLGFMAAQTVRESVAVSVAMSRWT